MLDPLIIYILNFLYNPYWISEAATCILLGAFKTVIYFGHLAHSYSAEKRNLEYIK